MSANSESLSDVSLSPDTGGSNTQLHKVVKKAEEFRKTKKLKVIPQAAIEKLAAVQN